MGKEKKKKRQDIFWMQLISLIKISATLFLLHKFYMRSRCPAGMQIYIWEAPKINWKKAHLDFHDAVCIMVQPVTQLGVSWSTTLCSSRASPGTMMASAMLSGTCCPCRALSIRHVKLHLFSHLYQLFGFITVLEVRIAIAAAFYKACT